MSNGPEGASPVNREGHEIDPSTADTGDWPIVTPSPDDTLVVPALDRLPISMPGVEFDTPTIVRGERPYPTTIESSFGPMAVVTMAKSGGVFNQDCFGAVSISPPLGGSAGDRCTVVIGSDGVGGYAHGDLASKHLVHGFTRGAVRAAYDGDVSGAAALTGAEEELLRAVTAGEIPLAVYVAPGRLQPGAPAINRRTCQSGGVLTGAVITRDSIDVQHLGDTKLRIFRPIRNGEEYRQVFETKTDNLLGDVVDALREALEREPTAKEIRTAWDQVKSEKSAPNAVRSCFVVERAESGPYMHDTSIHSYSFPLYEGDIILLMSDGAYEMLCSDDYAEMLSYRTVEEQSVFLAYRAKDAQRFGELSDGTPKRINDDLLVCVIHHRPSAYDQRVVGI